MLRMDDSCATGFGREQREQELRKLVRVHDARLFLPEAAIQTLQHPRLDALAPEHVIRDAVPHQLFGQHAISIKRTDCRPKPLPVQVRPDGYCELLNATDLQRIEDLDNRRHHATLREPWVVVRPESNSS